MWKSLFKFSDERDAIQKKTFTKWLNKHLKKHWRYLETYTCLHVCYSCRACCTPGVNRHIDDLFEDLRDGHNLISLLEVLSGELVPRERGRMRFHQLQNVQIALDFLKNRNIKLVNIRPEDIVDGNPKLTLGLIWTIILHFQISDIITGLSDETVSAREALLKWAQRTTERYPGVRITDFTNSWKDGLAFNAILHRNRPDLLDFRSLRTRNAKENLELAFSIAEKEFGITKLLDPEDVDTPEPDEKSLITYISSIYDVFPEPPPYHPFADDEKNRKIEEYKDLAINLQRWMLELLQEIKNQKMCNTLIDLKSLLLETSKFRSDELPKKNKDKQRLSHLHREIQKMSRDTGRVEFLKDLQLEEIEKNWNRVTVALQERDQKIRDEICRLEKLQKITEKFNRESKLCDGKLDDIERRINDEEKRIQRLHIVDAKYNCDQIESEFKHIDDILKSLKKDITILEEKNYHQIAEMKIRLENIRERSTCIKKLFQCTLVFPLTERSEKSGDEKKVKQRTASNDKAEYNKTLSLKEHFDWIERKQKRVDQIDFGKDYQAIKANLDQIKNEQKSVELYKKKIASLKTTIKRSDADNSSEEAEKLESKFQSLESFVAQKLRDSESLLDFIQSASRELKWMKEREEAEVSRDWSAKNLNLVELEHHQETLTNDLEKREIQFNAVQSRGESLLLQKHPAAKCIEEYLANIQNLWSWLLQLTLCLEIHLSYAQMYHQYFKEAHECEQWLKKNEDKLNTTFSRNVSSIDEGERYLKQMEDLRDDLTRYNDLINGLEQRSHEIVPLKSRKIQSGKALSVIAICNYKNPNIAVSKDEKCTVKDTSHKVMWKIITSSGVEGIVPGVCFLIPPPNPEAIELGQSLKKKYDDVLSLWKLKQRKLRQNLILATMKVVKTWDISHFRSMDVGQRESIMRALNTDAQKLISEGSDSEPALVKLKQEMEQCNNLFNTLLKKINEEETEKSPKTSGRKISDTLLGLQNVLNEKEKFMKNKLHAPIMWDLDTLENLVIQHKDFEIGLRALESQISEVAQAFKSMSRKTTALQMKYDTLIQTWDRIWESSNAYIEKLKAIEVGLHRLNEAIQAVSNVEVHLASGDNMPAELGDLQKVHDSLLLTKF
ncbi:plectin-like [Stegodyphus dumicola]|uniref:plectin-like n=1 Tax=Stegodyphus dumicola TaxID=202533 RepID=UPI0015A79498|nr:plectin-like [Stegodyphus dumicola]